jgi:hypothetical protein
LFREGALAGRVDQDTVQSRSCGSDLFLRKHESCE